MDADRLKALLTRLPTIDDLDGGSQIGIISRKKSFPDPERTLRAILKELNVPQLEDFLVWIPPSADLEPIGNKGFAMAYAGNVKDYSGCEIQYAMKELNISMVPELVLNIVLSYSPHARRSYSRYPTIPPIGISQHPETKTYLMAMSYARGGSLEQREKGSLNDNWFEIASSAEVIADRLAGIHSLGYTHNDLHPGNVMFWNPRNTDNPFLIDIGLNKSAEDAHYHTGTYGRLDYLPPEAFEAIPQTKASDVYCFGTLLWQLVTGVPPSGIASVAVKMRPGSMREDLIPGAPSWFSDIIIECWNPVPDKRPKIAHIFDEISKWRMQRDLEARAQGRRASRDDETHFLPETLTFIAEKQAAHKRRVASEAGSVHILGDGSGTVVPFHTSQFHDNLALKQIASDLFRAAQPVPHTNQLRSRTEFKRIPHEFPRTVLPTISDYDSDGGELDLASVGNDSGVITVHQPKDAFRGFVANKVGSVNSWMRKRGNAFERP